MHKKRGLGSGLNELLSDIKPVSIEASASKASVRHLPIDLLKPGKYQPRRDISQDTLTELADSIRTQGIIQPVIVRPIAAGNYEIIAGERRWRAAQLANLHEVPVVVREISDEQAIALSLIENIQREDLNAIDTAMGLQRLIDEFGMTHESAASVVGKSRATVTNLLRLLSLPEEIQKMVQRGDLEMGHARALLTLDLAQQLAAAKMIVNRGLSARAAESLVRQLQKSRVATKRSVDPNTVHLQKQIADKLAAPVSIQHAKSGKGKIIIQYNNLEELEGILKHIN
jgi:ParB family transcriptional regulator, chromosome partitioning protein